MNHFPAVGSEIPIGVPGDHNERGAGWRLLSTPPSDQNLTLVTELSALSGYDVEVSNAPFADLHDTIANDLVNCAPGSITG